MKLDESLGWSNPQDFRSLQDFGSLASRSDRFAARIVYPRQEVFAPVVRYGDVLRLNLQTYETVIVQVEPRAAVGPVLVGARYRETGRSGRWATYEVFAQPGQGLRIPFVGQNRPLRATLDDQPVAPVEIKSGVALPLAWPGQ